jgi:hypothetical protein
MNSDNISVSNFITKYVPQETTSTDVTYRGINFSYSYDYQRDMFRQHKLDVVRMLKECIDLYIDNGLTHRLIHPIDLFSSPVMLLQWEVHGDKLITKMSRA